MIRVTNHRGEITTYPTSFLYDGKIIEEMMYGQVTKIEKQVKNLSLEELNELGARTIRDRFDAIIGILFNTREYDLGSYIDITELVKEVSNE